MIRARVVVRDHPHLVEQEIERRSMAALNQAAIRGALAADKAANSPKPIARFDVITARRVFGGFQSGLKAGPLVRIFEKGSLGSRQAPLKRGRKPEWQVNRGANPYVARRHDTEPGTGVSPRRILQAARREGRRALVRSLSRR